MNPTLAPMPLSASANVTVDVRLEPGEWHDVLRRDALAGLTGMPREISPTWLYDDVGSELFEAITRLPEYYPSRAERAILAERADDIARITRADTLVELGSGTSEKTRALLDAMVGTGRLRRFVPFDVAEPTLRAAADAIAEEYPGVCISGVVGDFRRHLHAVPRDGRRLIAFLGGTIGNLGPTARAQFLAELADTMSPGDALLLGADLVKDRSRLVRAYDDDAGVTAAFNKNVLHVLNRQLDADFDVDRFEHVAFFDEREEWIEMRLRSTTRQVVDVRALGLRIELDRCEDVRTEISAKFRRERLETELTSAGFRVERWWTDPAGDYSLSLSTR